MVKWITKNGQISSTQSISHGFNAEAVGSSTVIKVNTSGQIRTEINVYAGLNIMKPGYSKEHQVSVDYTGASKINDY